MGNPQSLFLSSHNDYYLIVSSIEYNPFVIEKKIVQILSCLRYFHTVDFFLSKEPERKVAMGMNWPG